MEMYIMLNLSRAKENMEEEFTLTTVSTVVNAMVKMGADQKTKGFLIKFS